MNKKEYLELRQRLEFQWRPGAWLRDSVIDLIFWSITAISLLEGNLRPASLFLLPIVLFRCFSQMHEAVHSTLFPQRRVNHFLGALYGGLCFLPFEPWRRVHIDHHYWSGHIQKDPTLEIVKQYATMKASGRMTMAFLWYSWLPLIAVLQHAVFWMASVKKVAEKPRELSLWLSVAMPLALWIPIIYLLPSPALPYLGLGIGLYMALVEFVNLPHHLGRFTSEPKAVPLWLQYETTRSCRYLSFFEKYIVLNFNFHSELLQLKVPLKIESGFLWMIRRRRHPIAELLLPPWPQPQPMLQKEVPDGIQVEATKKAA
jgi:omega-6 fatty acid desaturase (delta-12 desaturase)